MKNFIKFIAYLQVIGIVLVVFGHSFHEYPDGESGRSILVCRMLYSFRMPLFIFVSGFLMVLTTFIVKGDRAPSLRQFTFNKIRRLLIPFFTLTLVTFIPRTMMSGMADESMTLSVESLWQAFIYKDKMVIPYFWFLQASFILLVLNYSLLKWADVRSVGKWKVYLGLTVVFAVLSNLRIAWPEFFSINRVVEFGLFFTLGGAYAQYARKVDAMVPWTSPMFPIAAISVWAMAFFAFEGTGWMCVCSLAGILMCISITKIIERRNWGVLDHLIGANYMIFLLSWYCNIAMQQILSHYVVLPWWVHTVLSLVSGVYVPWLGYRYIQRHPGSRWVRVSAFLLGQRFK